MAPPSRKASAPEAEQPGKVDPKAVFVRGLPEGATDNELRAFLEPAGATLTCYRIRGDYGIAQFKEGADASKCIEHFNGKAFKGSILNLSVAKPKRPAKAGSAHEPPAKKQRVAPDEQEGGSSSSRPPKGKGKGESSEKRGPDLGSVLLRGLPKNLKKDRVQEWIEEKLPGGCGIESVRGAGDMKGGDGGSFVVSFRKAANAMRALEALNEADLDGSRISATLRALEANRQSDKAGRLIVRNLAFGATAKHLRKTFEPLGAIADVHLPMHSSGKNHRGFAFVQFVDVSSAERAIAELNGAKVCGRGVAVDLAVGSGLYSALQKEDEKEKKDPEAKTSKGKAPKLNDADNKDVDEDEDDKEEEDKQEEEEEQEEGVKMEGAQLNTKGDSEKERAEEIRKMKKLLEESDKEDEEEDDDKEEGKEKKPKRKAGFDVDQGRTVFVRNVPFDGTEADMLQLFKRFGVVKSVKLLSDKSGQNKHCGTAFVQFREVEGAEAALAAENEADRKLKELSSVIKKSDRRDAPAVEGFGISLKGRRLIIRQAVTPESAGEILAGKKPEKGAAMKERQSWMHLLHVGEIRQGTDAWERLSKSEQNQRMASMKERKWRINNSNFAIHPLRLSVRNLPRKIGSAELRTELLHQLLQHKDLEAKSSSKRDRMAKAQEILETVSIVRDDDRRNVETNERRSRGFGFIQVKDHKFALAILEHLNDNPKVFGASKRPIVEFTIEDKRKLRMQQEFYEKNAYKLLGGKEEGKGKGKGKDKGNAEGKGKGKGEKGEKGGKDEKGEKGEGSKGNSSSKKIENQIKRKHVIKAAKKEGKVLMSRGKRQREKKRARKALEVEKAADKEAYNTRRDKSREEQKSEKRAEVEIKAKVKRQLVPDAGLPTKKKQKKLKAGEMTDDFELRAMERFRQGKR